MDLMKLQDLLNECIMIEQGNYLGGNFSVDLKEVQIELDKVKQLTLTDVINWVACKDELPNKGTYETWNGEEIVICEFEPIYKQFIGNTANGVKDDITHWKELSKPPCL